MTSREFISGALWIAIAIALASACALSNGTFAALLAVAGGLLPVVWVLRDGPAPR